MKKTLSLILSLIMVLTAFSAVPFTALAVTEYDIWVGGTRVTSENWEDIPAAEGYEEYSGRAYYEYWTNTLIFHDYIYKGEGYNGAAVYINSPGTLTISVYNGMLSLSSTGADSEGDTCGIKAENGSVNIIETGFINGDYTSGKSEGLILINNDPALSGIREDCGIYVKDELHIDDVAVCAETDSGKSNYGIKAGSITAEGYCSIISNAGECSGESAGICADGGIAIQENCERFDVSGFDGAVKSTSSSKAVIPAEGAGWAKPDGSGSADVLPSGEYSISDLSSYKKLLLPVKKHGKIGDDVYYSIVGEIAYIYGSGKTWDFNEDTFTSPFYIPDRFDDDPGSYADPENYYTLDRVRESHVYETLVCSIYIAEGITGIGSWAFADNSVNHVTFPSTLTSIGDNAFSPSQLKEVLIPGSVTSIGKRAFTESGCCTIVSVPGSIKTVPEGAFYSNTELKTVVIEKGVERIEKDAFSECGAITDVYFTGTQAEWEQITIESGNSDLLNADIHYNTPADYGLAGDTVVMTEYVTSGEAMKITVMASGDIRGEKVSFHCDSKKAVGEFTEYNPLLRCSIAVLRAGALTPGTHDTEVKYSESLSGSPTAHTATIEMNIGKYRVQLEKPEDKLIICGEDTVFDIWLHYSATGAVRVFLTKDGVSTKYILDEPMDGLTSTTISGLEKGEYDLTVNYYGDDNYLPDTQSSKLTVAESITVSPENEEISYGEEAPDKAKAVYVKDGNQVFTADEIEKFGLFETLPCKTDYQKYGDTGLYTLSIDGQALTYNQKEMLNRFTLASSTLTVNPAGITITADNKETNHGADLAELTYSLTGTAAPGDDLGITLSSDADITRPGTYTITPSWNGNTNYTATLVYGKYTVGDSPHYYGTDGEARYTCSVCGKTDDALKKACLEKDKAEFAAGVKTVPGKKGVTVKWNRTPEAQRYSVYAAYCNKNHTAKYKMIKTVNGDVTSLNIKKINGKKFNTKKNLKIYIAAEKQVNGNWVKIFKTPAYHTAGKKSKYTNIKKIKVNKAKYTLKKGGTAKIKAKIVLVNKKKKPINHVKKFRYMSTNTAVAKVDKNGKIKAVGKGTATVYVFSNNGTPKAIEVTVN